MKIRAAVCRHESLTLSLEDLDLAAPRPDEVLVRLVGVGICHTDLTVCKDANRTPRPVVLGHEGAGMVEKVGSGVSRIAVGDRVVMSFDYCGICPSCVGGAPSYCDSARARSFGGSRPDGTSPLSRGGEPVNGSFFGQSSFATHAICTERNAVKIRTDLPLEILGPLGCGIQTGAGAVMNALQVRPGGSIAVFGTGAVGMSAIMAARLVGATTIIAIDLLPARRALALELGATHAIDPTSESSRDAIRGITGRGVDFAVDTTASSAAIADAIGALGTRGTCALIASQGPQQQVPVSVVHMMGGGRGVRGVIEGDSVPQLFIPMLADLHAQGRLPFDRLVKTYPFERINDALRDAEAGTAIKPVLVF